MYLYAFTLYSPSHLVIPQPLCHLNHLSGGTMAFCRCPKVNPGSSFRAHPTTHGAHALRSGPPFIGAGRIWYMRLSTWSVGYLRIPLHKMDGVHYFILFQFFLPPTKIEDYIWMVYLYLYVMIWVVHCPFVSWNSMKPAWSSMAWVNRRSSRLRWGHLHPFHTLQIRCLRRESCCFDLGGCAKLLSFWLFVIL